MQTLDTVKLKVWDKINVLYQKPFWILNFSTIGQVGAQVILLRNLTEDLVNGSRGVGRLSWFHLASSHYELVICI